MNFFFIIIIISYHNKIIIRKVKILVLIGEAINRIVSTLSVTATLRS